MRSVLGYAVVVIFAGLGLLHFYWAAGGRAGKTAAIPSTGGVPHFVPSKTGTTLVALALFAAATVVALASGILPSPLPPSVPVGLALVLATVMAARAVGDFRIVGFFKKPSDSRFAYLDTRYFSPLCAALALGIVAIVWLG